MWGDRALCRFCPEECGALVGYLLAPRKYVFWDAIQYLTGQRYTLGKLQNAGNFKLFSHRVLERTL